MRPTRCSSRPTTLTHENTAWAVFGDVSYDVTDKLTVTGGARYTDDEKDLSVRHRRSRGPQSVSDEQSAGT